MTPLQDGVSADPDAAATAGQGRNGPEMALPSRCLSRRDFLWQTALAVAIATSPVFNSPVFGQMLKDGVAPVPEPHFPSRLFLFVWRNWELANTDRLAQVLETDEKSVLQLGAMLGLPPKPKLSDDQLRRIYITVIRQNWHVLPHQQLIQLLGWDQSHYEFILKEDDFLWSKLGRGVKPKCNRLLYKQPSAEEKKGATNIRHTLERYFGSAFTAPGEPPFQFVQDLSNPQPAKFRGRRTKPSSDELGLAGLKLVEPSAPEVRALAQQWTSYLQAAFGTRVRVVEADRKPSASVMTFQVKPDAFNEPESFEIESSRSGVKVSASDLDALRQAVYHLQDLVEERQAPILPLGTWRRTRCMRPCYIYPYFALYGDALADPSIDPFPEGYLEKLGRRGVSGIWIQAVLRTLAPSPIFPEFGAGWEKRLENLRRFVARAKAHGLKIYLYINEPRAMPRKFFEAHPDVRGTPYAVAADQAQEFALCTSVPQVRDWLRDSLNHVFSQVPELGGIFTITASENLTNCFSGGHAESCPNCSKRQGWEVVTEVLETFRAGVQKANPAAEIIAWDWGWDWVPNGAAAEPTIAHLPAGVSLLSVSEWGKQYTRGGVPLSVAEYSMSVVGPGQNALDHWAVAKQHNIPRLAKVQLNNTWEISAVPYIPVPNLIAQHLENLLEQGISGLMLSWTLGGYPSPNLEVAKEYYYSPKPAAGEALKRVATRRYGSAAAPKILAAWEGFSIAFQEFPYGVVAGYNVPLQHGPANPLRLTPTGYAAGMILFPYDDLKKWLGPYSPQTAQFQFEKMAEQWNVGLDHFRQAIADVPAERAALARKDLGIAETCYLHFRSVANQIQFYALRSQASQAPQERAQLTRQIKTITQSEIKLAQRLYALARSDSTIGYEASNHYYYRPLDLAEKILNCQHVLQVLENTSQ